MKNKIIIVICLGLFFIAGFYLEKGSSFSSTKNIFQDRSIPSPILNFGKRGRIMEKLGLKYIVPDDTVNINDDYLRDYRSAGYFQISRRLSDDRDLNNKINDPYKMPSCLILDKKITNQPIPIMSITAEKYDLYDESVGIYANYLKKGRNWERPCYISFYENGKLLFASGAGIRIHGGGSRSWAIKSFRLYFRKIYGETQFGSGILFNDECDPVEHLVVRNDLSSSSGFQFTNALPYDISREAGCPAPYTKPVKLYLNGASHGHGNFLLIEHLSREFLLTHYGHDNYIFYRLKGEKGMPEEYKKLVKWAKNKNKRMTMKDAEKYVSMQNLSRWWISNLFCANTDPYQGAAVLDLNIKDSKWFWINWDMDHSFRNKYNEKVNNIWEQEKVLRDLMNKASNATKNDPRAVIFSRLAEDDPEFRVFFEKELMDVLNHRLTQDYLKSRIKYYENTAKSFAIENISYIDTTRKFLENRPAFLMKMMKKYIHSPESYSCRVKNAGKINLQIDGYGYNKDYNGLYFKGSRILIKCTDNKKKISSWLVNGKKQISYDGTLAVIVKGETAIEPIMD